MNLDTLTTQWKSFKDAEDMARRERIAIEEKILEETGRAKSAGPLRISYGTTKSIDQAAAMECYKQWPEGVLFPLKKQFAIDAALLKTFSEMQPDLYKKIAACITEKPSKPSFTYKGE